MDIFNLLGKGDHAGVSNLLGTPESGNNTMSQPPAPPAFTEEQQEEVLKFLDQLDEQKENDPEAYIKNLRALGLVPEGVEPTPEAMNSMSGLAEAIGSMRSSVASTPTMAVNLPGGKSMLGKEGIETVKQTPGITITPEPGFSVKTKVLPDGPKVFLNLCTHTNLGEPTMKKRLNDDGEPVEGMNVPVSVGPVHKEQDKNGTECLVFDMIVNPKVLEDANEDETGQQRDFLCHLSMQSVEQKNANMMFDRRYKLPKLKYMGAKIHSQYIRDSRATPKIEEVNGSSSSSSSSSSSKKATIGSRLGKTPSVVNTVVVEPDKDLPFRVSWIKQRIGTDNPSEHHAAGDHSESTPPAVSSQPPQTSLIPPGTYETPWESTNHAGSDYTEPILVSDDDVVGIAFLVDLTGTSSSNLQPHQIEVRLSPFKLHIKMHGYKPVSLYFPCAVLPPSVSSSLQRPEGYLHRLEYCMYVQIDRVPWDAAADAGSKPWLMAQALNNETGTVNGEDDMSVYGGIKAVPVQRDNDDDAFLRGHDEDVDIDDELPENKFHLKLPKDVDQYTGVKLDNPDEELPEDRFHKKDAASQFLLNQREQSVKDKWAKHEKEKKERSNDPNIEYVDIDDYKPGGKFGGPVEADSAMAAALVVKEELKKAAEVVAKAAIGDSEIGGMLQSTLWTELLD